MMDLQGVAHAKINLYLDVVGRREDGYHLIDGVMQSLELGDNLRVRLDPDAEGISLRVTGDGSVPTDRKNLAWLAAERFLEETGLRAGVSIELEKKIPAAGGLGGGSSDAACVLRLLNRMAGDAALSEEKLVSLAGSLGADLPFCLRCPDGAMRTQGVGEMLTPVPALPDCTVLVAKAGDGVSTPWAYGLLDEMYRDFAQNRRERTRQIGRMLAALDSGDLGATAAACYNIFERAIVPIRPWVQELRRRMRLAGAETTMMSGSGPSVFGLFSDRTAAETLCEELQRDGVTAFVTVPCRKRSDSETSEKE